MSEQPLWKNGHAHTDDGRCLMVPLPIGSMDEGDQRPQGVCDNCGQLVTGDGRAPAAIEVAPGTTLTELMTLILTAGDRGIALRRCPVCGMRR